MKNYLKAAFYLVLAVFVIGFALPYLLSANDDMYVLLGVMLILLMPVIYYKPIKKIVMKLKKLNFLFALLFSIVLFSSCSKVPAGYVGIKFHLLGSDKGVDYDVLKAGRYHIGMNEELYLFPTFTQNYVWTKSKEEGSENDESFNFQDVQGLALNADMGITYHLDKAKVPDIFQKYKRGIDEITDVFLRNMIRDAIVKEASQLDVEYIYGKGKAAVLDSVKNEVSTTCKPLGILIDELYWIGQIRLPKVVQDAIDNKIKATQVAQQRENELREAEAAAKKKVAEANGEAESILTKAEAQAKANRLLSASLTPSLVEYKKIEKWNGQLPQVSGSSALVSLK